MSSCEDRPRPLGRRGVLAGAGWVLGAGPLAGPLTGALLGGCGFRPLHGRRGPEGVSTVDDLARIRIEPIGDRPGQILVNFLRDRLNPRGLPARPRYLLDIALSESTQEVAVLSDETATRANLRLQANYRLSDSQDGSVIIAGHGKTVTSYNIVSSQFATLTSENDARERGLRELADDLRSQLAVYFSRARDPRRAGRR